MRHSTKTSLALALCLSAVAGCAEKPAADQPVTETVRIDGSPGILPMLDAMGPSYQKLRGNADYALGTGLGSGARLDSLEAGRIDIAVASHGVDSVALAARGMTLHLLANVPVGFGVHEGVPVKSLTQAQVCDIYAGRTTNWSKLGGPDLPIVAVTRPKGEVDADVMLAAIPCLGSMTMDTTRVVSMEMPHDMANHVARTPGAIGMMSGTMVRHAGGNIRAIALDGVEPTAANVESGAYRIVRQTYLVTKSAPKPEVQRLLDFFRSTDGKELLRSHDAAPVLR